ncbi:MAG: hypothetical protein HQL07_01235 [Nitrospirae bacterium]|nr:hypothetical protein [Magnetococcales bacterium]HAT51511.1 hypothetical protein [Alphaproteobacteria bacterium]
MPFRISLYRVLPLCCLFLFVAKTASGENHPDFTITYSSSKSNVLHLPQGYMNYISGERANTIIPVNIELTMQYENVPFRDNSYSVVVFKAGDGTSLTSIPVKFDDDTNFRFSIPGREDIFAFLRSNGVTNFKVPVDPQYLVTGNSTMKIGIRKNNIVTRTEFPATCREAFGNDNCDISIDLKERDINISFHIPPFDKDSQGDWAPKIKAKIENPSAMDMAIGDGGGRSVDLSRELSNIGQSFLDMRREYEIKDDRMTRVQIDGNVSLYKKSFLLKPKYEGFSGSFDPQLLEKDQIFREVLVSTVPYSSSPFFASVTTNSTPPSAITSSTPNTCCMLQVRSNLPEGLDEFTISKVSSNNSEPCPEPTPANTGEMLHTGETLYPFPLGQKLSVTLTPSQTRLRERIVEYTRSTDERVRNRYSCFNEQRISQLQFTPRSTEFDCKFSIYTLAFDYYPFNGCQGSEPPLP